MQTTGAGDAEAFRFEAEEGEGAGKLAEGAAGAGRPRRAETCGAHQSPGGRRLRVTLWLANDNRFCGDNGNGKDSDTPQKVQRPKDEDQAMERRRAEMRRQLEEVRRMREKQPEKEELRLRLAREIAIKVRGVKFGPL